jgi:hypothetical protein
MKATRATLRAGRRILPDVCNSRCTYAMVT